MIKSSEALRRDLDRTPLMSAEVERAELAKYAAGDAEAGRRVVAANVRFVIRVAGRYRHDESKYEEVIAAGLLGLAHALRTFDVAYGVRFLTHAAPHVRVKIQRHIQETERLVSLPTHHHARTATRALLRHGDMDAASLAEVAQVSHEDATLALMRDHRDAYLGQYEACDMHGRAMGPETVPDPNMSTTSDPVEAIDWARASKAVRLAVMRLSSDDQVIVRGRMMATEPVTLVELGKRLGISRDAVRYREEKIAAGLRKVLAKWRDAA